ncbi:MAG: hypothetical protein Q9191_007533 [Dirinaria sp. TL-2023a]
MSVPKPGNAQDSAPDLDILGDQVTIHPAGYIQPLPTTHGDQERNLVEHMARFRESPFDFLREVSLHVSGAGWRSYDDVIGQPIFYSGFTENMKNEVLGAPLLRRRVADLARNRVEVEDKQGLFGDEDGRLRRKEKRQEEIKNSINAVAEKMTDNMICKLESKAIIRGAYYMCTQLLTRAYHQGIHVSSEEVLRLRSVAEEAVKKRQSIIFLPCHRSHVDYVSLQIICYRLGIASYISELLGQPKPKENLRDFLSASSVLSLRLGRVDVRFHEPWSLQSFIATQRARVDQASVPASLRDPQSTDSRIRLLRTLGFKVLSDINAVSVVMPTALVGTVLLTLRGRGVGKSEFVRRVDWLSARVRDKGGRVAHFAGAPTEVVVERALEVLGPDLIGTVHDLADTTYYAVDRFQLSFYRNMTIHLFISEALVSASMYTRVKLGGGPDHQRISFEALHDQVLFLSQNQLFRGEFIYPTEGLLHNLEKTLRGLEADEVVLLRRDSSNTITTAELSNIERSRGRENYDFYCFLIWPFIESTWLGAVSLISLTPRTPEQKNTWLNFKQVQHKAQLLGKTLHAQGDLSYFEAVNTETLKHAFELFAEEGIVVLNPSRDPKIPSSIKLASDWTPARDSTTHDIVPTGKLWEFTEMIARSRREGKNRRDGATVSSRVLKLADIVGKDLFASAATPDAQPVIESTQPNRSRKRIEMRARL